MRGSGSSGWWGDGSLVGHEGKGARGGEGGGWGGTGKETGKSMRMRLSKVPPGTKPIHAAGYIFGESKRCLKTCDTCIRTCGKTVISSRDCFHPRHQHMKYS